MPEIVRRSAWRLLPWLGALAVIGSGTVGAAPLHRKHAPSVRPRLESISVFAGPCRGGGCAVYQLAVRSNGVVTFHGMAHTAGMGVSTRSVGRAAYQEFAASLSPYRPRGRAGETGCTARAADEPTYRIVWSDAPRGSATLDHSLGCSSPRDVVLNAILTSAPAQLGIEDLTAPQQTPASIFKPHIFYF